MRTHSLLSWGLCLVVLAGCGTLLEDLSGTLCNPDGTCGEGYHCSALSQRCELGAAEGPGSTSGTGNGTGDAGTPDSGTPDSGTVPTGCGNNRLDPGETCDDGNVSSSDDCLGTCVAATCGDSFVNQQGTRVEACDDGNTVTETSCPYGTPTCSRCTATCSATLNLTGNYCGDNKMTDAEKCDDGNAVTETSCPYGMASCTRCDATCSSMLNLTGAFCGDSRVNGSETCDDGNTTSGDGCSSICKNE